MTQQYELMFIVPGSMDEAQVPAIKNHVLELVTGADGALTTDVELGRRRLAYKINQQSYGYYFVMQFTLPTETIQALDTKLRLDSEILRYLLIKADLQTAEDIKKMMAEPEPRVPITEPVAQTHTLAHAPVHTPAIEEMGPTTKRADLAPGETKAIEEADAPASIEELDKKLDAILDDSNIDLKI